MMVVLRMKIMNRAIRLPVGEYGELLEKSKADFVLAEQKSTALSQPNFGISRFGASHG